MNLKKFAQEIAKKEGKKKQINIGQIKEVLNIIGKRIREMDANELIDFLQSLRRLK
ncbi:MAG: hypothetical protein QXI58_00760 [Candidatus Micrarchaeia archaeon]